MGNFCCCDTNMWAPSVINDFTTRSVKAELN